VATRIYVGNLPYTADNEQLSQLFSAFGEVVEAAVIMDRETGRSKGFGFVQMANEGEAHNAIASLNGTMFGNRTIRVNEAQPRPERTGGGGYRQGGGYGGGYSGGYGGYGGGYSGGSYSGGYGDRPRRHNGYGDEGGYNGGGYGRTSYDRGGYDRGDRGGRHDRW
jgi:RNA recognition motif-containing protein